MIGLSFSPNPATPQTPLSAKAESLFEDFSRMLLPNPVEAVVERAAGDRGQAVHVVELPAVIDLAPDSACCLCYLPRLGIAATLGTQLKIARLKVPRQLVRGASALERLSLEKVAKNLRVASNF